jgi:hypothetical protein
LSEVGVEYSTLPATSLNLATNYARITRSYNSVPPRFVGWKL